MWAKAFMTDVVLLVCVVAFICWAEDHYARRVPLRVKQWGGAILLASLLFLPISLVGHIWS
jgi:hypothetical protein